MQDPKRLTGGCRRMQGMMRGPENAKRPSKSRGCKGHIQRAAYIFHLHSSDSATLDHFGSRAPSWERLCCGP